MPTSTHSIALYALLALFTLSASAPVSGAPTATADLVINSSTGQTCHIVLDECGLSTTPDGNMLVGQGAFSASCPQNDSCLSFPNMLVGPATVRRGTPFTVTWQALNAMNCSTELSRLPGSVTNWPWAGFMIGQPTVCTGPVACGQNGIVSRTLTATTVGTHLFALTCRQDGWGGWAFGPYINVNVTP